MNKIKRIQGTDGVRGEVALDSDERVIKDDPIATFVEKTLITPQFARLYARTFIRFLREKNVFKKGKPVVVAYDPRDRERSIIDAVIKGVTGEGVDVIDAGVLPTPCCGMYTVQSDAAAGIMITASHNPADQNGIKLFLPDTGLKLFPAEEEEFTTLLYSPQIERTVKLGRIISRDNEIRDMVTTFFSEPFNSWKKEGDYNDIILVVDSANGAFSNWTGPLLASYNFRLLEEVGNNLDDLINDNCGAGLFEGHKIIDNDFHSDSGSDFRKVDLIQALFRHGRANREELVAGHLRVAGAAFDGDGDRFYGFEYDPFQDAVTVLSGDEVAFIQAAFIRESLGDDYNLVAEFVTTVESDIAVSVAAEKEGLIPVISGVGDKWLLWEAWSSLLGMYWSALESSSTNLEMLADLEEVQEVFAEAEHPEALVLNHHLKAALDTAKNEEIDLLAACLKPEMVNFTVGSEETGHSVTLGLLRRTEDDFKLIFFGNGFKSLLNLLAATENLYKKNDPQNFYQTIKSPFTPGYKSTRPVYYTDKTLLAAGSLVYQELEKALLEKTSEKLSRNYRISSKAKNSEPDMVFIEVEDKEADASGNRVVRGTIFIRNSGTEAKTSIYARCEEHLKEIFEGICNEGAILLSRKMKNPENPYCSAEREILLRINETGASGIGELMPLMQGLNPQRLILEMTLKQGILEPTGEKLQLTEFGKKLI